jgi:hypothetical protein
MVVTECLVDGSQDGFSHLLSPVQVVVTVGEDLIKTQKKDEKSIQRKRLVKMNSNLRFDNWDQTVGLADGGIAGQNVGVFQDGLVGRGVLADLEDASPLGELASIFLVLGAASVQIVQTFATTTTKS